MFLRILSVLGVMLAGMLAHPTWASERVALVIGNSDHEHVSRLANPANDASDIGAALGRLGFDVTRLENTSYQDMRRGLQDFKRIASGAEMAVVFYAGHGIEVDKDNFLIPVDARLRTDGDIEFETVSLDLVARTVELSQGTGPGHPGRLPEQSFCDGNGARWFDPLNRPGSGAGGAGRRDACCLRRQGRHGGIGRDRGPQQPLYRGPAGPSGRTGP